MTPDAHTNQEISLEVGDSHTLYVQDWGYKDAPMPIMFLHGGPGSASQDKHKTTFDPTRQRVIFHDQRGCGRSLPYGSLENNTTADLVEDIEKIAVELELDTFIITGGSWGSCLALAYAVKYPQRVAAMVLRGIFTGSHSEIDWLDKGRFQTFYPDAWQAYLDRTPEQYRDDPSAYHFKQVLGDDKQAAQESGYAYETLERSIVSLDDRHVPDDIAAFDPTGIRMEMYYMANQCFIPDRYILDNASKLTMPVWLVQGRYDMVCPPVTTYELHRKLPKSELVWTTAGHAPEREMWNVIRIILLQLSQASQSDV